MASSESLSFLTPHEVAAAVGVGVQSIRRWCEWHAAHLSPGANPGAGMPRRLVARDVEVLKEVKDLRYQGLQTEAINERLAGLTFPEIEEPGDQADNEQTALDAHPASPEGPGAAQLPAPVQNDLGLRLDRLERSLVEVQGAARPNWWWFAVGLGAGLGLAAVAELFALVASRGR